MATYFWFVRGAEHAAMCRQSIASVRKVDTWARCFVVTDEPQHDWDVGVGVYKIEPGRPIMLANLEAQVVALGVAIPNEPVVFLDTDVLLVRPLPMSRADLLVTWRDHVGVIDDEKIEGVAAQMPYNYGVMVAEPNARVLEAFIWMRERVRKMHSGYKQWYGNQLALAELCGPKPADGEPAITHRSIPWSVSSVPGYGISVARVPCDIYNYTPQAADEDISSKVALHFKGKRRELMPHYAERLGVA
jgi:hypothetical protein